MKNEFDLTCAWGIHLDGRGEEQREDTGSI